MLLLGCRDGVWVYDGGRMDLHSLNVFVEVVRQGGFTAASRRVHLTQPSISRVIRQLEENLGHVLITRDHREVALTDAGKIVYRHALGLLGASGHLRQELQDLAGLRTGELSLGIPPLGGTLFVPLIKSFKSRHPAIELRLFELGSKATESHLISASLDLGTLLEPVDEERFHHLPFSKERLVLVAALDSRWAARRSVLLKELAEEPFILFPDDFGLNDHITQACGDNGFVPHVVSRSSHAQLIMGLVESGMGVALLPFSVAYGSRNVALVELEAPSIEWNVALAWAKGAYLSHAARALIRLAEMEGTGD